MAAMTWTSSVSRTALADDVWVRGSRQTPTKRGSVRIRGDRSEKLLFVSRGGTPLSRPIGQVVRIHLDGEPKLDEAEALFQEGDCAKAIVPYELVRARTSHAWLKRYVTAKLVTCHDAAGHLADAIKAWVETLAAWPTHGLTLRPKNLTDKGPEAHEEALRMLADALADENLAEEARQAIEGLQAAVKRAGPGSPGAVPQRARPAQSDRPDDRSGDEAAPTERVNVVEVLGNANRLFKAGRYDEAVQEINRAMPAMAGKRLKTSMPQFLVLKARYLLAKGDALADANKKDEAKRAYVYAGLAAMHVVTFFPESQPLVEALYLTARCHERIGLRDQAAALYAECREYAIGRGRSEWKAKSAEALERLDVKPK